MDVYEPTQYNHSTDLLKTMIDTTRYCSLIIHAAIARGDQPSYDAAWNSGTNDSGEPAIGISVWEMRGRVTTTIV